MEDKLAQRLVQYCKITGDAADKGDLTVAWCINHGDVDTVLVDVQPDEQDARFS